MSRSALSYAGRALRVGALALLVGSALLGNLANLGGLLRITPAPNEEMALRDRRFEPLRKFLPTRAILGYVSDSADVVESQTRLMLAEFSLAPLILIPGADQPMVVGDFSGSDAAAVARQLNLTLLRDFGNGVALFARSQR